VFASNPGSCRVLERCGYQFEGRMRQASVKNGQVLDSLLYATVREFKSAAPTDG
jgi:RimJ/RimL family protein N-acetyltransferase